MNKLKGIFKLNKDNTALQWFNASLSRDYLVFAILVSLLPVVFIVCQAISLKNTQSRLLENNLNNSTIAIEQSFTATFSDTQDLVEFIADKIIRLGQDNLHNVAPLIESKHTIDINFRNIYSLIPFSWVNADGMVQITSDQGVVRKPFQVDSYYPVAQSKYSPWELQVGHTKIETKIEKFKVIPTAMSVEDSQSKLVGTLVAKIPLELIKDRIEEILGISNVQYLIFDKDKNLILKSDKNFGDDASRYFPFLDDVKLNMQRESKFEEPIDYNGSSFYFFRRSEFPFIIVTGYKNLFIMEQIGNAVSPYMYGSMFMFATFVLALFIFRKRAIEAIIHLSGVFTRISFGDANVEVRQHLKSDKRKPKYPYEIHNLRIAATKCKRVKKSEKKRQKELHNAYRSLAEKTTQLEGTKLDLERAMRIADTADQAKRKLIHNIRKNTKSALNGVRYPLQILLASYNQEIDLFVDDQRKLEYLREALESLDHVEAFTSDILNEELLSPIEVLQDCIAINSKIAYNRGVDLSFTVKKKKLPEFFGDYIRLTQIFNGVIFRSIDLLPKGRKVEVALTTKKQNKEDWLVVQVRDNGFGLSQDERDKILKSNGGSDISRNVDGTQLSVSSINKLVILHKGEMEIEDRPGKGSKITVTIPFRKMSESDLGNNTEHLDNLPKNVMLFPFSKRKG